MMERKFIAKNCDLNRKKYSKTAYKINKENFPFLGI